MYDDDSLLLRQLLLCEAIFVSIFKVSTFVKLYLKFVYINICKVCINIDEKIA